MDSANVFDSEQATKLLMKNYELLKRVALVLLINEFDF